MTKSYPIPVDNATNHCLTSRLQPERENGPNGHDDQSVCTNAQANESGSANAPVKKRTSVRKHTS